MFNVIVVVSVTNMLCDIVCDITGIEFRGVPFEAVMFDNN